MMKALLLALVLALLFVNGSALKCYNCFRGPLAAGCVTTQETCGGKNDACVSGRYTIRPFNSFYNCISMTECKSLQSSIYAKAGCCQTDLCNKPSK